MEKIFTKIGIDLPINDVSVIDNTVDKELFDKISNIKDKSKYLIKYINETYRSLNSNNILSMYSKSLSLELIITICSHNVIFTGPDGYNRATNERKESTFFINEFLNLYRELKKNNLSTNLEYAIKTIKNNYDEYDSKFMSDNLYLLTDYDNPIYSLINNFKTYNELSDNSKAFLHRDNIVKEYAQTSHGILNVYINVLEKLNSKLAKLLRHYVLSKTDCENFGLNMCSVSSKKEKPADYTYGSDKNFIPNTSFQIAESLLWNECELWISSVKQEGGVISFVMGNNEIMSFSEIKELSLGLLKEYNFNIKEEIDKTLSHLPSILNYEVDTLDKFLLAMYDLTKES